MLRETRMLLWNPRAAVKPARCCETRTLLWNPHAAVKPARKFSHAHAVMTESACCCWQCLQTFTSIRMKYKRMFSVLILVWRRLMKMRVLLVFLIGLVLRDKETLTSSARTSWIILYAHLPYAKYCNIFVSCTAAAQSTCTDLQRLADSGSGIVCSRNPECNELRCNVTHLNIPALVHRATITVLPCNQPAAAQLVLYNSNNTVILNETQDRTASHPFGNNLLSVQLMVTVEHPTGSQIRLGVKCLVNVFYTESNIVQIDCLQFWRVHFVYVYR